MDKIIVKNNDVIKEKVITSINDTVIVEDNDMHEFNNTVRLMIQNLNKANTNYIDILMSKIKKAKSYNKLSDVVYDFLVFYIISNDDGKIPGIKVTNRRKVDFVNEILNKKKDYATKKIINDIINCYYTNTLSMLNNNQIEDLLINMKTSNIFSLLSLYNRDINKNSFNDNLNDMIIHSINNCIISSLVKNRSHLCWDCEIANPLDCPKIRDRFYTSVSKLSNDEKQEIDKYPFITDGLQILKEKNIDKKMGYDIFDDNISKYYVNTFLVYNCDLYKNQVSVKKLHK